MLSKEIKGAQNKSPPFVLPIKNKVVTLHLKRHISLYMRELKWKVEGGRSKVERLP